MIILLSILNLFDYILTLLNRGNFEEAVERKIILEEKETGVMEEWQKQK